MQLNEHRSNHSRSRRNTPPERESLRERLASTEDARDLVRNVFIGLFAFVILACVLIFFTAVVRIGFVYVWSIVIHGIPALAMMVWADPWLLAALVVAALLAWSRPWEDSVVDDEPAPRRGPRVKRMGSQSFDDE